MTEIIPEDRRRTHFEGKKDKEFIINSMRKCVTEKREMDKFLEKLISPYIKSESLTILDACCGIGHISYFLSNISPKSSFVGIDQTSYLIDEARKLCVDKKNISFEIGDMYDLSSRFAKKFDITINWRTLSWLPYYDQMLKDLFSVTKKHIFISSLFYDGDIDFEIKVREFKKETGIEHFNDYYNIYSFPRFEKFAYDLNAKHVESYDFELNIDIPMPPIDQMGSYTLKLEDGKRLQVSGSIILPWKIVRIDL